MVSGREDGGLAAIFGGRDVGYPRGRSDSLETGLEHIEGSHCVMSALPTTVPPRLRGKMRAV